jgi:hypothetical protein
VLVWCGDKKQAEACVTFLLLRHNRLLTLFITLGNFAFPAPLCTAELPRELLLLRNIKLRMKQNLTRVPNYTCLETMVRSQRAPSSMVIAVPGKAVPYRRADVVRFEVAEVDSDELFALPGNHDFKKMNLRELSPTGLMGNGAFSLLAHQVFTTDSAQYHFGGEEKLGGQTTIRYDFRVSQLESGYQIYTPYGRALVGFHGTFWADSQTFDVIRMEIEADDIPPSLRVDQAGQQVEYGRVRIGASSVLLPQSGAITMRQSNEWASRNQLTFTHCREYGVESTLSFEDVNDSIGAKEGTHAVELPVGLQLTIRLDTPIDSEKVQVGDAISAKVEEDARLKGKVVVHKDALVSGRLRRLEQHLEGWPYVLARLEFTGIEFDGKTARFFAELEKIIPVPGSEGIKRVATKDLPGVGSLPGVGTVSQMGNRMLLPAGTRMIWKTLSYDQAAGH